MTYEEAVLLEERNQQEIRNRIAYRNDVCPICGSVIPELADYLTDTIANFVDDAYTIREGNPFYIEHHLKEIHTVDGNDGFYCSNCDMFFDFEFNWNVEINMNMKLVKKYMYDENNKEVEIKDEKELTIVDHPNQIFLFKGE